MASEERGVTQEEIRNRARRLASRVTYRRFVQYSTDLYTEPIPVADVPVLTDDFAPVETLIPLYHWTPPTR